MAPLELPHGVDEPPALLLWRLDDLIPLILMLVIGMLIATAPAERGRAPAERGRTLANIPQGIPVIQGFSAAMHASRAR